MAIANSDATYGTVARIFHWLTALLIFSAIVLGLIATNMAEGALQSDSATLARVVTLFSLHKTIGVAAFFVALLRILWALGKPHPKPLHPEKRLETALASLVHWLLYGAMVVVPLSGWVHHAAQTGYAPIWWPFGQGLPFVPQSETVATISGTIHHMGTDVLMIAIALHIAGALKHALIDRDGTLARMAGRGPLPQPSPHPHAPSHRLPAAAALALWAMVLAAGTYLATPHAPTAHAPTAQAPTEQASAPAITNATSTGTIAQPNAWQVQSGTIAFDINQFGANVGGNFQNWQADITFNPDAPATDMGRVEVQIDITSLSLGSLTSQALGADFFDATSHPTAQFSAKLSAADAGYVADGVLRLKGQEIPVALPFQLSITDDIATLQGETRLDRRDFGIGAGVSDEGQLGFGVLVKINLTAKRGA